MAGQLLPAAAGKQQQDRPGIAAPVAGDETAVLAVASNPLDRRMADEAGLDAVGRTGRWWRSGNAACRAGAG